MPASYSSFYNETRAVMLAENARVAADFFSRLRGLLGTSSLENGHGLWIKPCSAIHMFGMSYAIDALFMDKQFRVVGVVHNIKPGRLSRSYRHAYSCLELPSGILKETETAVGDVIRFTPKLKA